jgi:hypothetical protein
MHCGISLRKSNGLDFYYNFRLVEEAGSNIHVATKSLSKNARAGYRNLVGKASPFESVYADYGYLYFRDGNEIYRCSMSWQEQIGISTSE